MRFTRCGRTNICKACDFAPAILFHFGRQKSETSKGSSMTHVGGFVFAGGRCRPQTARPQLCSGCSKTACPVLRKIERIFNTHNMHAQCSSCGACTPSVWRTDYNSHITRLLSLSLSRFACSLCSDLSSLQENSITDGETRVSNKYSISNFYHL